MQKMTDQTGQWRALAHAEDVVSDRPLAAACAPRTLVLFRDALGAVRALEDRCAHRRAPLSLGRVTADGLIECPYHGWSYDGASGVCRRIPNLGADERVPEHYGVAAFAAAEHDGFVYVWTGAADGAPNLQPSETPRGARTWRDARLLAFPCAALLDLVLDAPSLVLDLTGAVIADDRRLGEPRLVGEEIVSMFEADYAHLAGTRERPPSDYPLTARIGVSLQNGLISITLHDAALTVLASALIVAAPVREHVTSLIWRGAGAAGGDEVSIGVRGFIDGAALARVLPYAGPMRRAAGRHSP